MNLNDDQREEIIRRIDDEFRRRTNDNVEAGEEARAAQQTELVQRDDPVTSNESINTIRRLAGLK